MYWDQGGNKLQDSVPAGKVVPCKRMEMSSYGGYWIIISNMCKEGWYLDTGDWKQMQGNNAIKQNGRLEGMKRNMSALIDLKKLSQLA